MLPLIWTLKSYFLSIAVIFMAIINFLKYLRFNKLSSLGSHSQVEYYCNGKCFGKKEELKLKKAKLKILK